MNKSIKKLLSTIFPTILKMHLLNIWKEYDSEFSLFSKTSTDSELFQSRFIWNDLDQPISAIKKRFGTACKTYLITDREDYNSQKEAVQISLKDIELWNTDTNYALICAFESDEKLLQVLNDIKIRKTFIIIPLPDTCPLLAIIIKTIMENLHL